LPNNIKKGLLLWEFRTDKKCRTYINTYGIATESALQVVN